MHASKKILITTNNAYLKSISKSNNFSACNKVVSKTTDLFISWLKEKLEGARYFLTNCPIMLNCVVRPCIIHQHCDFTQEHENAPKKPLKNPLRFAL